MSDQLDLIVQIKAQTFGSRSLDAEIYLATVATENVRALAAIALAMPGRESRDEWLGRMAIEWGAEPYSTSIDAALTLVPDGWSVSLGQMMGLPLHMRWRAHLRDHNEPYNPATCKWVDCDCVNPALALCAATLKAKGLGE